MPRPARARSCLHSSYQRRRPLSLLLPASKPLGILLRPKTSVGLQAHSGGARLQAGGRRAAWRSSCSGARPRAQRESVRAVGVRGPERAGRGGSGAGRGGGGGAPYSQQIFRPKEEKGDIVTRAKGNSWVDDQPTGENAFNTSDANIGCQSEPKNLHHNIDMPVVISSSVEYARRPPPKALCWTGCIVLSNGENPNFGEFKAYHPARVSPRVCNIAKNMPNNVQLKIFPRMKYWPTTFEQICPVYDDGLDIFLRNLTGIDVESYLWGVFMKPKAKSNPVT